MLLTDSDIISTADLIATDPEVGSLPGVLGSNVPPMVGPESVIRQAADHTAQLIGATFQSFSGYMVSPGLSASHVAAVMNIQNTAIARPRVRPQQVCALEPDPTKRYVARYIKYYALYVFFRSLYHSRADANGKGDRYQIKMDHYNNEAQWSWERLEASGLPVVLAPLSCPGAIRDVRAGSWDTNSVSAGGSGSTETGNTYDVVITYTGPQYQSWRHPKNNESAPSATVSVAPGAGQLITVDITSLNPPDGTMNELLGISDGVYAPMAATGWNVYVGLTGTTPVLQNSTPIPLATTSFTLPDAPVLTNRMTVGVGQSPDFGFAAFRVLKRG